MITAYIFTECNRKHDIVIAISLSCQQNVITACILTECNRKHDIVILLDFSGSEQSFYRVMVRFIRKVIHGLDFRFDRTRLGLATYAQDTTVSTKLNASACLLGHFHKNSKQKNKCLHSHSPLVNCMDLDFGTFGYHVLGVILFYANAFLC